MGGTIASLRGYIENRGGNVIAALVMTAHIGAVDIAVDPYMLERIKSRHGPGMNKYFEERFGYGIEKLTQAEAAHVRAASSIDEIRTRITEARHAGIKHLDVSRTKTTSEKDR